MNRAFVALAVTLLIQAVLTAGNFSPAVLAPAAQYEVGATASGVGILTAVAYAASTVSSFFSGALISRIGALRLSQACLVVCAIGMLLLASGSLAAVFLGVALLGSAYGPATPASSHILVARTPARLRATVLSIKQTGVPIGGALCGAVLPSIIVGYDWQTAAIVVAVVAIVAAALCEPVRGELDAGDMAAVRAPANLLEPLRLARTHARLREISMAGFTFSGLQMCYVSYLVLYLVEDMGYSLVRAGAAMSGFMVAGMIGRVLWGAVSDRTGRGRTLLGILGTASATSAVVLASATRAWPEAVVLVLCVIAGATVIGGNGVFLAEVAQDAPEGRVGAATGGAMMACYLGAVVVPLAFWAVHATTASYPAAFAGVACLVYAGASLLLRSASPASRAEDRPRGESGARTGD